MHQKNHLFRLKKWKLVFFLKLFGYLIVFAVPVSAQQVTQYPAHYSDSSHHGGGHHRLRAAHNDSIASLTSHTGTNSTHTVNTTLAQAPATSSETQPTPDSIEKNALTFLDKGDQYLAAYNSNYAIAFFYKGLEASRDMHSLPVMERSLKGLSDAYSQKQEHAKALYYYKQYSDLRDSVSNWKDAGEIVDLTAKLDREKAKSQELERAIENKINKPLFEDLNILHYILFGVIILLGMFLVVLLFKKTQKKSGMKPAEKPVEKPEDVKKKPEDTTKIARPAPVSEFRKEDIDHYTQIALLGQINPRFIFHSLNKVQGLILQNDTLAANDYLSKFVKLTGKVMANAQHEYITLGKELEVVELYIEMQRVEHQFNCTWSINKDEDLAQYQLPPLILLPFVEDALFHGLIPKSGDRMLTIAASKESGQLICMIEDNGVARTPAKKPANAKPIVTDLQVSRISLKRIEMLNSFSNSGIGVQHKDLQDKKGKHRGTKVIISLPARELSKVKA